MSKYIIVDEATNLTEEDFNNLGATLDKINMDQKTDAEMEEATKFTEAELQFVDDMTQAIFDQANADELRPYVLTALCGSILSNLIRGSEGMLDAETVLKFTELATNSQLDHECCDGECNHDDCCGKVEANCPNFK